ncbi:hypothetical protein [Streptomyces sp. NPDC006335]|uniref:hypothetical protein n=1 Tax=Streptomyces sp. NPDC006335 TaxID=3156895 RepID=UPI0033B62305
METRPVTSESEPTSLPTPVDQVGEKQVQHVLAAAERIFVSLTGYTGFDRDLSQEILAGVLKSVSAEQQHAYVRQLEAFAEAGREPAEAHARALRPVASDL